MTVRVVEGKKPYTGGEAIDINEDKVISLKLRDENNLIIYDSGDDEIYVDLQLPDGIQPTDAFPVGVNTGRVLVADGWDKAGTLISAKTTSGDYITILYADDGTLWMDNGTGTYKQVYFKSDVDGLITTLTTYINTELAKKQNGVVSSTAPSNPSQGDLWYDTTNSAMKVWDGTAWQSVGTGGGGSDIEYVTQAEYNALLPGAESDGKHYFVYTSSIVNVTGVTLNESSISLTTALDTYQLTATVSPNDATDKTVNWSSSDNNIATVDQTGLVTCVTPGTCTITVTTTDGGFTATCGVSAGWTPGVNTLVYYKISDSDTNSTIYDLSGNSIDQTWQGTASYSTDATYGRVASFDGSNCTAAGSRVNFGNEITFITLVKTSQNGAIVTECGSSSAGPIGIFNGPWDNICAVAFSGSGNTYGAKATVNIGTGNWTMVAGTRASDGTCKIYINGVLDNTETAGGNPNYSSGNNLKIGDWGDNSSGNRFHGDFKLFIGEDRCRTDQEIADLATEYGFTVS